VAPSARIGKTRMGAHWWRAKGPGGWWRIAKNAVRFLFRLQERPLPIEAWIALLEDAGFVEVIAAPVVAEAAVVVGVKPNRPFG
jgi:hypothetical protein